MSSVHSLKLLASAALLFSGLGLCGCYDLGDPTGPTAADFEAQKNSGATATAENDETAAPANCPDGTCPATVTPVASLERRPLQEKATEKVIPAPDLTAEK